MNIEELRNYCLSKQGATEDLKWGSTLTFLVGDKIFVLCSAEGQPTRCSLKVDEETFFELIENENFKQAPYLAKKQWVQIQNIELESDLVLKNLIETSYDKVFQKLTKKAQKEIVSP